MCSETGCLKGYSSPGHPSTPKKTVLKRGLLNMERSGDQGPHSLRVPRVCEGETPVNKVKVPMTSHILRGRLWTVVPVLLCAPRLKLMMANGKYSTPRGKWPRAYLGGPARWGGLRGASLDYVHAEEAEPHQLFTALCFLIGYDYDQLLLGPAASIPCYAALTAPLNCKPEHTLPLHRRQERN